MNQRIEDKITDTIGKQSNDLDSWIYKSEVVALISPKVSTINIKS